MFTRTIHTLTLTLVSLALGCGGSSSTPAANTPAPPPQEGEWQLEVINQASAPFDIFVMENGRSRGARLGRVRTGATTTFNIGFRSWGLGVILVDQTANREIASRFDDAPRGASFVMTITQSRQADIRMKTGG